jgi:hypothetical protein
MGRYLRDKLGFADCLLIFTAVICYFSIAGTGHLSWRVGRSYVWDERNGAHLHFPLDARIGVFPGQ